MPASSFPQQHFKCDTHSCCGTSPHACSARAFGDASWTACIPLKAVASCSNIKQLWELSFSLVSLTVATVVEREREKEKEKEKETETETETETDRAGVSVPV